MKVVLMQTGKTTDAFINEGVEKYSARIKRYCSFTIVTIPELRNTAGLPVSVRKEKEAGAILQQLGSDDYVVLLDERGKENSTIQLAGWLAKVFQLSKKRLVFVIGGPWGFQDELYKRADYCMSLSKLTFSHQVVRLLFAEQLYRVLSVLKGDPYHHE